MDKVTAVVNLMIFTRVSWRVGFILNIELSRSDLLFEGRDLARWTLLNIQNYRTQKNNINVYPHFEFAGWCDFTRPLNMDYFSIFLRSVPRGV